ncbi:hypothetical protein NPIL_181511 [Nephila pilipes]|uniref:Uncharacterized protein n=1 Tax=Nephila pilipes TaxID=299642 RepID=A0A8X6PFR0_NEPPI|nr:hypothetical protein NPIL_181511 [Nephila pilipes]
MVTVCWSGSGVIHYSCMEPSQSITADVNCYQLDEMMRNLAIKQPKLVKRMNFSARQRSTTCRTNDQVKAAGVEVGNSPSPTVLARPCRPH